MNRVAKKHAAALAACFVVAGAHAESTELQRDGIWRFDLGVGASVASGNTRTSSLAIHGNGVRARADDKISIHGQALRGKSNGETTAEQVRLGGRYDRDISVDWFGFGGLDLERNRLANLSLRSAASLGAGYHAVRSASLTLDLLGGAGYTADRYDQSTVVAGETRGSYAYPSLVLGDDLSWTLTPTTSLKQRLQLFPNLREGGDFRANLDLGMSIAMTETLSVNLGWSMAYNSDPGTDRQSTDTLFTTGVTMKFE